MAILHLIKEYLFAGVDLDAKADSASELRSLKLLRLIQSKIKQSIDNKGEGALSRIRGAYLFRIMLTLAAATQDPPPPSRSDRALTNVIYNKHNETVRELLYPVVKGALGAFGDISYLT